MQKQGRSKIALILGVSFVITTLVFSAYKLYFRTSEFGRDYYFDSDDNIIVPGKGKFDVSIVGPYNITGRVLAIKIYRIHDEGDDPSCTFSPVDLFMGVDDVCANYTEYDFDILSWEHRDVEIRFNGGGRGFDYFVSHTGNNHMIPHNAEVHRALVNLQPGDLITVEGYLVNIHHTEGNMVWSWNTDTKIGNPQCEIILVDNIVINGHIYNASHPYRDGSEWQPFVEYMLIIVTPHLAIGIIYRVFFRKIEYQ